MLFEEFSFGSIRIDGVSYDHDIVIDRGEVRKRKKKAYEATTLPWYRFLERQRSVPESLTELLREQRPSVARLNW